MVQAKLGEWGIPLDGINLVDGSGLDRGDRLTCSALQAVLRRVGSSGPIADGLPIAGQTGTLSDQFAGNPAVGRLRAKTGTLRDARALSGFVDSPDGSRHISFSYVQNGPNADARRRRSGMPSARADRVPDRAPVDQLAPLPPPRPRSRPCPTWSAVATLPMFPLGTVLFPGALLPLHIFEERYRQLVNDCLADEPEFGVVLIDRGHEVGGGDVRREVGTVARILEVAELPDGRYFLQAAGVRRIRVQSWLDDAPYPRADVEEWPDEDASLATSERVAEVANRRRARALASELHEGAGPRDRDRGRPAARQLPPVRSGPGWLR